jgi:hypothetical protein
MKKYFLSAVLWMLVIIGSQAQPFYFNKYYSLGNESWYQSTRASIETNSGYLSVGSAYSGTYPPESDVIHLFEVNHSGNLLWQKDWSSDSLFISPSGSNIYQKADSTYEWFIEMKDTSTYIARPAFIQFDRAGNILFSKVIDEPLFMPGDFYYAGSTIQTNDRGYLMVCNSGMWIVSLFKLDSNLKIQWRTDLGNPNAYTVICNIIQLADSSYILGTGYRTVSYDGEGRIYRLGKDGVVNAYVTTGLPTVDGSCFVNMVRDSSYLVLSTYPTQTTWWGEPTYGKIRELLYDKHWNLVWSKMFSEEYYYPSVSSVLSLPDSTLVAVCYTQSDNPYFMFRISLDGDSLLSRQLSYTAPPTSFSSGINWDGLTSDGGILFSGEMVYQEPGLGFVNRNWLLKTDWYGCSEVGCDPDYIYVLGCSPGMSICKGELAWFGVQHYGGNIHFQWQEKLNTSWLNLAEGFTYGGTQTDTLNIIHSDSLFSSKTYRCMVFNENWHLYSDDRILDYSEAPLILQQPGSTLTAEGDKVFLTVLASGIETPIYQWYHNGEEVVLQTDDSLMIVKVTLADSGYYSCHIWNHCGEAWSDSAWLAVKPNGIDDDDPFPHLSVFPNPADQYLHIAISEAGCYNMDYFIYQVDGSLLENGEIHLVNGKALLRVDSLPPGLFLLKLNNEAFSKSIKFSKSSH